MKRMQLLTVVGIMLVAFAGLTGAAQAKKKPVGSLTFKLDAYEPNNDGFAGPVASAKLPEGSKWVAEVEGTISYYAPSQYTTPEAPFTLICGTPDFGGPIFASPDKPNAKPVGMDAEFIFGRPSTRKICRQYKLPSHWPNFQLNSGSGYKHPAPTGPELFAPTADHKYGFPVNGHDKPALFRLKDRPRTSDNYGQLQISLRPATAADCGDFHEFEYADQASCEAALGGVLAS